MIEAFAPQWLPTLDLRAGTVAEHESYLRCYILPALGGRDAWRAMTSAMIEEFYRDVDQSAWVTRRVHVTLRRMLADAVRRDVLRANPPVLARPTRLFPSLNTGQRPHGRSWTLSRPWSPTGGIRCGVSAVITGVRRGELAGLRWDDI